MGAVTLVYMRRRWALLGAPIILTLAFFPAFAPQHIGPYCPPAAKLAYAAESALSKAPLFPRHTSDGLRIPALMRWPAANASCDMGEGAPLPPAALWGTREFFSFNWVAARAEDAPFSTTETASIWEVSRVSTAVRREIWARFSATLAAPFEEVSILSPALVYEGSRFLFFSRISPLNFVRGSFMWYQELPFSFAPDAAPAGEMFGIPGGLSVPNPGPEDPRVILFEGAPLVLFNAQFANSEGRNMFLADVRKGTVVRLRAPGVDASVMQKNWAPFLFEGALHFLYSAQPLVVLRFSANGTCTCVFSAGPHGCGELPEPHGDLRLGSPLTPLSAAASDDTGLFVCALHSKIENSRKAAYTSHVALLSTRPWGWVAVSSSLPVTRSVDKCASKRHLAQYSLGMVYPTSALLVGDRGESLLLGAHVNDAESTVQQIEWETPLMDRHDELVGSACELRAEATGPAAPPRCKRWAVLGNLSDSSSAFFVGIRAVLGNLSDSFSASFKEHRRPEKPKKRAVPATVPSLVARSSSEGREASTGKAPLRCPRGLTGRACFNAALILQARRPSESSE